MIVFATGYKVSYSYIDPNMLETFDGVPNCYLHIFPYNVDNLFFVGLAHPNGGFWETASYQSKLIASYISAKRINNPSIRVIDKHRYQSKKNVAPCSPLSHKSQEDLLYVNHITYNNKIMKLNRILNKTSA
jgi:hypothetical protein